MLKIAIPHVMNPPPTKTLTQTGAPAFEKDTAAEGERFLGKSTKKNAGTSLFGNRTTGPAPCTSLLSENKWSAHATASLS